MLKPVMEIAAAEIATGKSLIEVAKVVRKHRSTLMRWLRSPEFQQVIKISQKELRERILKNAVIS